MSDTTEIEKNHNLATAAGGCQICKEGLGEKDDFECKKAVEGSQTVVCDENSTLNVRN